MKILVVEDQLFIQNAITDIIFETRKDVHVDFFSSPEVAIEFMRQLKSLKDSYDIVVSDLQFEGGVKSFAVVDYCSKQNVPTMVFTMFENFFLVELAMKKGVKGYISKYDNPDEIIEGLNKIFDGQEYMSPRIIRSLNETIDTWVPHPIKLSNTERNILYCLSSGMSMKEIVDTYQITDNTLRAHRRNMMKKNNCNYEKLLACFNHFPPKEAFDPGFLSKQQKKE
jgi:DNA-binding NarL/FixJ family response regulator